MRIFYSTEHKLTERVMGILKEVKDASFPNTEIEMALVPAKVHPSTTVLAFGKYEPTNGERVVNAPTVPQVLTKPDIITRMTNVFQLVIDPPKLPPFHYRVMSDFDEASAFLTTLENRVIAFDIETSGDISVDRPEYWRVISISISAGTVNVVFSEELCQTEGFYEALCSMLMLQKLVITVNGKFDLSYFPDAVLKDGQHFDVQLAHYALFPAAGEHGLKPTAKRYFGLGDWDAPGHAHTRTATYKEREVTYYEDGTIEQWHDTRKYSSGSGYERIPRKMLYQYNGEDTYATFLLYELMLSYLDADPDARRVFDLLMRLSKMFMGVERRGITLDIPYLEFLSHELTQEKAEAESLLNEYAGKELNPRSPKQVKEWFEEAGVKLKGTAQGVLEKFIEKNEGSIDTNKEYLAKVADAEAKYQQKVAEYNEAEGVYWQDGFGGLTKTSDPLTFPEREYVERPGTADTAVLVAKQLMVCRGITKQLGTYVDGYRNQAFGSQVYPGYKLHASTTGRLGGAGASMLTIPRDKRLKRMVIPSKPGNVVVGADASQMELRVMALESQDDWLIQRFQPDSGDFFDAVLDQAYPSTDWSALHKLVQDALATPEQASLYSDKRTGVKATIYGASFNRGVAAIAASLKIPFFEAQKLMNAFIRPGSDFDLWREDITDRALTGKDITTRFGRHFQSELITSRNQQQVINSAMAFTSQSTGNDLLLSAALEIEPQLEQYGATMMGTIHDAFYSDCPEENAAVVGQLIVDEIRMSGQRIYGDQVLFVSEASWGKNLAAA